MSLLEVKNVKKIYTTRFGSNQVEALRDVNFTVECGEYVAAAFKVMTKILGVLNLTNVSLFAVCTIITIAVFAAFYIIVYSITAKEYYRIVN